MEEIERERKRKRAGDREVEIGEGREREREREREGGERVGGREVGRERERVCVCVCDIYIYKCINQLESFVGERKRYREGVWSERDIEKGWGAREI